MSKDDGLRGLFREHTIGVHWQSVESAITGGGIPDLNGCAEGVDFWIEAKKTDGWTCGDVKVTQVGWIKTRLRFGGRVVLATRRRHAGGPRKGKGVDELWIHSGHYIAQCRAAGLRGAPALYVGTGGPSRWDWAAVREVLLRAPLLPPGQ